MRWDKALNYLIAIFLCVNILLAVVHYERYITSYRVSDGRIDTVTSILRKQGIEVRANLPISFSPRPSLWMEPIEITTTLRDQMVTHLLGEDRSRITITNESGKGEYGKAALIYSMEEEQLKFYKDKITYSNQEAYEDTNSLSYKEALKYAKAFVNRLNLDGHFEEVKIDYISESHGATVTYYEVYKGLPIFSSYVKMKVSPKGVIEAEVKCLKITDKVGPIKPLYPIDQVLFGLQDLDLGDEGYIIESVELGYRFNHAEGMHILSEEAVPMYKIKIKGLGMPVFVNAYTNTYEEILFISQV